MKGWKDDDIKKGIEAAMPQESEAYILMIENTILELKRKDNAVSVCVQEVKRYGVRWYERLAVAMVVLVVIFGGTFSIYPALAAEIPLISQCVYALSSTVEPKEAVVEKITEKVTEVLQAFLSEEQADIERLFNGQNELWRETVYLPMAYLRYLCNQEELHWAGDVDVTVQVNPGEVETKKKAFVYDVNVTFELIAKDRTVQGREECAFRILENTKGYYVQEVELQSEDYRKYVDDYMALYDALIVSDDLQEQIQYENALLIYQKSQADETYRFRTREEYLQTLLDGVADSGIIQQRKEQQISLIQEEQRLLKEGITDEIAVIEELASELMYRYYQGRGSGVVADFSDIMVRSAQTDLFFYEALLVAERTLQGVLQPLATVEKGQAEVLDYLQETENEIQVRFYVRTELDYGVGEEIILTFQRLDGTYMITGYDRAEGDGIYLNRLKPLAEQYYKDGMSREEANRLAYETVRRE